MSDIMSVMKTAIKAAKKAKPRKAKVLPGVFTVRDMNRDTATVLEACRQHGRVIVRHRSGEQFALTSVKAEEPPAGSSPEFAERIRQARERMRLHRERMGAMGVRGPTTREGIERLNRIIAGEE